MTQKTSISRSSLRPSGRALKLGASVQIVYADDDAVQQTQQLLSFIQEPGKRPDAILVEPVGTGMPEVAKAAGFGEDQLGGAECRSRLSR